MAVAILPTEGLPFGGAGKRALEVRTSKVSAEQRRRLWLWPAAAVESAASAAFAADYLRSKSNCASYDIIDWAIKCPTFNGAHNKHGLGWKGNNNICRQAHNTTNKQPLTGNTAPPNLATKHGQPDSWQVLEETKIGRNDIAPPKQGKIHHCEDREPILAESAINSEPISQLETVEVKLQTATSPAAYYYRTTPPLILQPEQSVGTLSLRSILLIVVLALLSNPHHATSAPGYDFAGHYDPFDVSGSDNTWPSPRLAQHFGQPSQEIRNNSRTLTTNQSGSSPSRVTRHRRPSNCFSNGYLNFNCFMDYERSQFDSSFTAQQDSVPGRSSSNSWTSMFGGGGQPDSLDAHIRQILVPRVSGSAGNIRVRQYIVDNLRANNFHVELDEFSQSTPVGTVKFANIVGSSNPNACRQLVLACHYDSKLMEGFLGATDSAVPCAMLLNLAETFNKSHREPSQLGLQFMFLDGEEAFVEWTSTDSLYGSRHLAAKLEKKQAPSHCKGAKNDLSRMELMVLLDLIGTSDTSFVTYNRDLKHHYDALRNYEIAYLSKSGFSGTQLRQNMAFRTRSVPLQLVEDDHVPFMRRGVPILSLLANPFPSVWHTVNDNYEAIDFPRTRRILHVLEQFVANYRTLYPQT